MYKRYINSIIIIIIIIIIRSFKPYKNEHETVKETREKGKKKHVTLTEKFSMKILFHYPLTGTFLSSNPKIIKLSQKLLPTKMKPTKCPAKEKNWGNESERKGEESLAKRKSQDCCVTFNPKNSKFWFLHMSELCKLIFRMWIRKPWNAWPANSFVVRFGSL